MGLFVSIWLYYSYDGLGSVRQTTDADALLRYGVSYDPYGNPTQEIVNPVGLGYTGAQTDENGLIYLHNRYYDPRTGSFLTPDPIDGGGAQWNAYAYVNGNPINNIDPDGCLAAAAAVGLFAFGFVADAGMQYMFNCGQVDWGQATISGGISVVTGGLSKVTKLGTVGKFAVETLLEATAFTAYDSVRGRNTNFFGNVADSAIGNVIGEGIGRGIGAGFRTVGRAIGDTRIGQAIGNSRIGQTQLTPYEYHLLHGGSAIDSRGRVRSASRSGPNTGVSLSKRRAWYGDDTSPFKRQRYLEGFNTLLKNEGITTSYSDIQARLGRKSGLAGHHMPSSQYMDSVIPRYNPDDGITIAMEHPRSGGGRHHLTHSYGGASDAYLKLSPRDALAYDIMDVRSIYRAQGLYTSEIRQGLISAIRQNTGHPQDIWKQIFTKPK